MVISLAALCSPILGGVESRQKTNFKAIIYFNGETGAENNLTYMEYNVNPNSVKYW